MKKIESLKSFKKHKLPIIPFRILKKENLKKQIEDFLEENNLKKFMIRTDGPDRFSPSIITANFDHIDLMRDFFDQGYVVFVMHPANRYRNFHSVNIMKDGNEVVIEVVGPGFIATDLNRTGLFHEEIIMDKNFKILKRKERLSKDIYKKEVLKRIKEGDQKKLKENKSYLLEYDYYPPLDEVELLFVKNNYSKLEAVSKDLGCENFIASLSFVDLGDGVNQPIFWDLYGIN